MGGVVFAEHAERFSPRTGAAATDFDVSASWARNLAVDAVPMGK